MRSPIRLSARGPRRAVLGALVSGLAALAACAPDSPTRGPTGLDRLSGKAGDSVQATGRLTAFVFEYRFRDSTSHGGGSGDTISVQGIPGILVEVASVACPVDTIPRDSIPNDTIPNDTLFQRAVGVPAYLRAAAGAADTGSGGGLGGLFDDPVASGRTNGHGEVSFDLEPGCYVLRATPPRGRPYQVGYNLFPVRVTAGSQNTVWVNLPPKPR